MHIRAFVLYHHYMSRTDLLFQMTQIIRSREFTTAQYLANRLNLSVRTIYRYINELSVSGIPILSQTGKGYWIDENFNLTPVHLSQEELLALNLGAKLVKSFADPFLADAAQQVLDKIEAITPKSQVDLQRRSVIHAPIKMIDDTTSHHLASLRKAADHRFKLSVSYCDLKDNVSDRVIWPLAMAFWGKSWTAAAWCEKRKDFRVFRVDRIQKLTELNDSFPNEEGKNLAAYVKSQTYDINSVGDSKSCQKGANS